MTGSKPLGAKRHSIVVQPRDRRLLKELATMRVINREQAKRAAGFTSTSRVNARLLALTRAGLLRRFFIGTIAGGRKGIYTLSSRGAAMIEARLAGIQRPADRTLTSDRFVDHQLHLNEVYLEVTRRRNAASGSRLRRWVSFTRSLSTSAPIVPDGYFELEKEGAIRSMFVEVDLGSESTRDWRVKIEAYLRLAVTGEFERLFSRPRFRVLIIVSSQRRLASIRSLVARSTGKIFWFSSFPIIKQQGFWSAVWLRPRGQTRQPLV